MKKKKPSFAKEILVGKDRDQNSAAVYDVILGPVKDLGRLDAEDGDYVAVYRLVAVKRYETNPRLR